MQARKRASGFIRVKLEALKGYKQKGTVMQFMLLKSSPGSAEHRCGAGGEEKAGEQAGRCSGSDEGVARTGTRLRVCGYLAEGVTRMTDGFEFQGDKMF